MTDDNEIRRLTDDVAQSKLTEGGNAEMDSDSDQEESLDDPDPLSYVAPAILAELKHLDLTGRVIFNEKRVRASGGFGDICIARCNLERRGKVKVAIKRLRFYLKEDIKILFEKEIYVWAKLQHPNILPLLGYAFDEQTSYPLLVSEWVKNGSAWTFVSSHPQCDLMRLVLGIAQGIAYLHENDIVHSDIKSDNVLIADDGDALICDFGCSRMLAASRSLGILTTGIKGTPRYLSYELTASLSSKHSKESDVWAFGMTVFELLTQERPYADKPEALAMIAIRNLELPFLPRDMVAPTSEQELQKRMTLWHVCELCWAHDPAIRIGMDAIVPILMAADPFSVGDQGKHKNPKGLSDPSPLPAISQNPQGPSSNLIVPHASITRRSQQPVPVESQDQNRSRKNDEMRLRPRPENHLIRVPKKKALLIAVKYEELHGKYPDEKLPFRLDGTHGDPPVVAKWLIENYGYDRKDIVILMDDGEHALPTKENIMREMKRLVEDAQPGDHFVFQFSGYGSQVIHLDGKEEDGYDEVIWPVDIEYNRETDEQDNYIIDDDLKVILVDTLPPGARLTCLLNCCHSGTGLDLPYNHSDSSLDLQWSPQEEVASPSFEYFNDLGISDQANPKSASERSMSTKTVMALPRSSTLTARDVKMERDVRGVGQSMKMPCRMCGAVPTNSFDDEAVVQGEVAFLGPSNNENDNFARATSWSVYMNYQLGIVTGKVGILIATFDAILSKSQRLTNKQMLEELSKELFRRGKEAKPYFKAHEWDLSQLKPCLGSLRPLEMIFDEEFTF